LAQFVKSLPFHRPRLIFHQQDRTGHFADYGIVLSAKECMLNPSLFMGAYDDQVDFLCTDQVYNFFF
jgi:hypothetical protein